MELILLDLRYPTDCSVLLFSRTFWSHILVAHLLRKYVTGFANMCQASQIYDNYSITCSAGYLAAHLLRKCVAITGTSAMKIAFGNG